MIHFDNNQIKTNIYVAAAIGGAELYLHGFCRYPRGTGAIAGFMSYCYGRGILAILPRIRPLKIHLDAHFNPQVQIALKVMITVLAGVFPAWASTQLFREPLTLESMLGAQGMAVVFDGITFLFMQNIGMWQKLCCPRVPHAPTTPNPSTIKQLTADLPVIPEEKPIADDNFLEEEKDPLHNSETDTKAQHYHVVTIHSTLSPPTSPTSKERINELVS